MKFVALLSGGKDSCFNISHCQKHGHQLVAAASLRPSEGVDELDSYLYQTVGQDAIEFVGKALGVPLYRRVITGTAVQMQNAYGARKSHLSDTANQAVDGDETEDMLQLLKEVLARHPDIQGVSVGAILSTYQRNRVEHVCQRLGLTSLSYLWQRDQGELLQEMVDSGVNAILIKVAGIGLKPQHLGLSLAQMQPILQDLHARFGSHICGEGGEYETLTLDCPAFIKKIVLTETETVITEDKGFATVAYWRIKSAELQDKPPPNHFLLSLTVPSSLDQISEQVCATALAVGVSSTNRTPAIVEPCAAFAPSTSRRGRWITIGNVISDHKEPITIEEETKRCFDRLIEILGQHKANFTCVVHINALLSTMEGFSAFNTVYSAMFGASPPARACVAVNLPPPQQVVLECLAFADLSPPELFSLHVQGISYWAPANIGPYSQAIGVDDLYHVSGQIGLIPPTMKLPEPLDAVKEIALALQHVRKVREVLPIASSPENAALYLGFIIWTTNSEAVPALAGAIVMAMGVNSTSRTHNIDNVTGLPPVLFIVPTNLPKGATVEVQALLQDMRMNDDDQPALSHSISIKCEMGLREESCQISSGRMFTIFWCNQSAFGNIIQSVREGLAGGKHTSMRIYCSIGLDSQAWKAVDSLRLEAAVTVLPVQGIFSMAGVKGAPPIHWDIALVSLTP